MNKTRTELYNDVWSEAMIIIAKKYGVSDNGLRKRCKALRIPIPPFGYWAKKKAGMPVVEKPPLPLFTETILSNESQTHDSVVSRINHKKNNTGLLELLTFEDLSIDQIENMHGFDLMTSKSLETFTNWCNSLVVPGRLNDYDDLISKHKFEIEYREARDKEYPFRDENIVLDDPLVKIRNRDNESVLPIELSNGKRNRAYRIIDTIIKSLYNLKASISIEHTDKDNISIELLHSVVSFNMYEHKSKRRYLFDPTAVKDFSPLYQEVFNKIFQINWQISKHRYYDSLDEKPIFLSYTDSENNPLEKQVSKMIFEVYKECCNMGIAYILNSKRSDLEFEQKEDEQCAKEQKRKQKEIEEEKQDHKDALIKNITVHANDWFNYELLNRYANELESYIATCTNEEEVQLLREYIQLVRENADKNNPLSKILQEMRANNVQVDNGY